MKRVLREIFSGANGKLSAKRVIGGFAMSVALGCTIYLVIRDGSTSVVENLLMTIYITSVSLLGLPAITSMWGSSKIQLGKHTEETIEEVKPEETVEEVKPAETITREIKTPDCDNCEYKNKHQH